MTLATAIVTGASQGVDKPLRFACHRISRDG